MALGTYPDNYLRFNDQNTKRIGIVVKIEGLDLLGNTAIFERIRYGMPGLLYGGAGLVYGGLIRVSGARDILSLDGSSLQIGQKIEPEQGRASVTTLSLSFIDKDGYMSQVISPGVLLDDILGKKIRVYLGYVETAFPDDYFTIVRGYITGVDSGPGIVSLQLSDSTLKKRQQCFTSGKTTLSAPITNVATTIPLNSTSDFYKHILGPDATYDTSVKTYLKIGDEFIEYAAGSVTPTSITGVTRGARGTTAAAAAGGVEVSNSIQLTGNAITLALKVQMSGWDGPYSTGNVIRSFVQTNATLGPQPNAMVLDLTVDAVDDIGVAVGDWITVTGSGAGNNGTYKVTQIVDYDELKNRILFVDGTFNTEGPPTSAVFSVRSQFDTLPVRAGLSLDGVDIDVGTYVTVRNSYYSSDSLQFHIQTPQTGKTFLESEIFLPLGSYPVSRYGKASIAVTVPPLASVVLPTLDKDTVLNPDQIHVARATNNRRFFNEITYQYDQQDDSSYKSKSIFLDTDSLNIIGISSVLPINSAGIKSALSGVALIDRRQRFLMQRYKKAAFEIKCKVNWKTGSIIESGDVVLLKDQGHLKITNFNTGIRDLGVQLFEVIERKTNLKDGNVELTLLSSLGFEVDDRYATISPSSLVGAGSTTTAVKIVESFGEIFPGAENKKWSDYVGEKIVIHSYDWTYSEERTFTGFDPSNDHILLVSPALSGAPPSGYIVDIAPYPTSTDVTENAIYKLIHAFVDPSVTVVSGISTTSFTVGGGDAAKFAAGQTILIHNANYSILSPEVKITSVVGVTITVDTSFGFTPAAGQTVELIGFADGGGAYRVI